MEAGVAGTFDAQRGIAGGVYTRTGGDMVGLLCVDSKVSMFPSEAVFDGPKAALSLGSLVFVLAAVMLSRFGSR
jgi:hypothetical protein